MKEFTEQEKEILRRVQGTLPASLTPFADIAREVGTDEETVLELLRKMKEDGSIRRFGATLRHQKAGYGFNAMVAWCISEDAIAEVGKACSGHHAVSHCYHRRTYPEWRFNLYTMVHGKSRDDCMQSVEELKKLTNVDDFGILYSLKELKKTSMVYF